VRSPVITHPATPYARARQSPVDERFKTVCAGLRERYLHTPDRRKCEVLSLVSHFPRAVLAAHGFPTSQASYATARRHAKKFGPGHPKPKPELPECKQPVAATARARLEEFLEENSQPAAMRSVKVGGEWRPVQYLARKRAVLYRQFVEKNGTIMSASSLRKYTPKVGNWIQPLCASLSVFLAVNFSMCFHRFHSLSAILPLV
jgi:hypothetical protein